VNVIRNPHSIHDFSTASFPEIVLAFRSHDFSFTDAQLFDATVRYTGFLREAEERVPAQWSEAVRLLAA
jgi:hypothetical protein